MNKRNCNELGFAEKRRILISSFISIITKEQGQLWQMVVKMFKIKKEVMGKK